MSAVGILFMVLICTVIWGGFLASLGWMMKSEQRKASSGAEESRSE